MLIKSNRITANKEGGIFACDADTLTTIKDNTISHNGMRGIGVQLGATAEIEDNTIEANAAEGIYVSRPGSRALIVKNRLLANGVKGVGVQYGADASVEGNTIADNKLAGVHIDGQSSRATVRYNIITGHPAAIVAEEGSVTRSHSNTMQDLPTMPNAALLHTALENSALSPRGTANKDAPERLRDVGTGGDAYVERDEAQTPRRKTQEEERGDLLATGPNVHTSLLTGSEESARQLTPRTAAGYQALLTPRDHHANRRSNGVIPSTPRGHVSRTLVLPQHTQPPANDGEEGGVATPGTPGVPEASRRRSAVPATPTHTLHTFAAAEDSPTVHSSMHDEAHARGSSGATSPIALALRGRLAAHDISTANPRGDGGGSGGKNEEGGRGSGAKRTPPPARPSMVPSLKLDQVKSTLSSHTPDGVWRAEVEGLASQVVSSLFFLRYVYVGSVCVCVRACANT